jgi:SAM-dependent methyltransferase
MTDRRGVPPDPLPIAVLSEGPGVASEYADGSEADLLSLFRDRSVDDARSETWGILGRRPSWGERVHLSPQRHCLLDWFPFEPAASLLEVGAGCGALTGLFAERVAEVVALEGSASRAEVIAWRHRDRTNLRIEVGDLRSLVRTQRRFDYVVCVGVLEYAGAAAASEPRPYDAFLSDARAVLAEAGTLLLAIENQIGLKYLAGALEDHYGEPLVGIEDYATDRGVRTFGRVELGRMLEGAGFRVERWYQPFPDYKLPVAVYSDEQPLGSIEPLSTLYQTPDLTGAQGRYFAQARLARILDRNRLLEHAANSHLVVCRVA